MLNQAIALSNAGRNAEAVQLVRQVAATGDPEALGVLAEMTWRGGLVEQDPRQARILFEQAAGAREPTANLTITNLLASGVAGKQDWQQALDRLRTEAQQLPARRKALDLIDAMDLNSAGDPKRVPEGNRLSDDPDVIHFPALFTPAECAT